MAPKPKNTTFIYFSRAKARNSQRDGPMTVDSNQDGRPNYYPNSFMGPADSPKWKEAPIQVNILVIIISVLFKTYKLIINRIN